MFARNKSSFPARWAIHIALFISLLGVLVFSQDAVRKVTSRVTPTYPDLAKKMHLTGKVKVEVVVNPTGTVTTAKVVGGNPVFETSAVEAVKQWKFEPAANATKGIVVLEFTE